MTQAPRVVSQVGASPMQPALGFIATATRAAPASAGSLSSLDLAIPSVIATETRRGWTPSCRSRSMLVRWCSAAATALVRIAADESVRKPEDPLAVARAGAARAGHEERARRRCTEPSHETLRLQRRDAGKERRDVAPAEPLAARLAPRLEVFRVDGATVTLRGRFLFGTEVGVRWVRIDARRHDAVVSWYQSLIPVRIDCIRGPGGATLADHGPRVALVTSEGAAPPPVPDLPDGGAQDAAVEHDAAGDVSAAAPASTPRSP